MDQERHDMSIQLHQILPNFTKVLEHVFRNTYEINVSISKLALREYSAISTVEYKGASKPNSSQLSPNMRPFFALISAMTFAGLASATRFYEPFPPKVCNNRTITGPDLEAKQQAALADFAHLYIDLHDIQTAYDRWVPG